MKSMLREIDTRFGTGVGYAYDPASRLTSKVYPDGSAVHYAYDGAGRPVGLGGAREMRAGALQDAAVALFALTCAAFACGNTGGQEVGGPKDHFEGAAMIGLAEAIQGSDLDALERSVAEGANVNGQGRDGVTPLGVAMLWKRKAAFRRLLELGSNPNALTSDGSSVMHLAAVAEDPEWLQLALSQGGDPNLVGSQAKTPIFEAISAFRRENVRALLSHEADPNHKDSTGDTPLLHAAGLNRYDLVLILLESGADYRLKNNWGKGLTDMIARSRVSPSHELYEWRKKVIAWLEQHGERVSTPGA